MPKSFLFLPALFVLVCAGPCASSFAARTEAGLRQDAQTYTNNIGMEFVRIPAGSFTRTFTSKNDAGEERKTYSRILVSKPFYLGVCQVTQTQWKEVMGKNPSFFTGPVNPVDSVSWNDAQEFIKRLNAREKHGRYRLPTEAEWELAAGGGGNTPFFFLRDPQAWEKASADLDAYAWLAANAGGTTHPVGQKKPNPYGVYDVYGNVWEWVQDGYEELPSAPQIQDYCALAVDELHVLRGGCWMCTPEVIRGGNRLSAPADKGNKHMGFRVVFSEE
ncbi:MAG: formylglycine-generating enzyme family protein [Betaproteobacteria bacterium]|nr:formylglycine-generating enzyme family protein [Betaproteobacteria bacterium]